MQRTFCNNVKVGDRVLVKGWVEKLRDLGNLKFFTIRDRTGYVQITGKKGKTPQKVLKSIEMLGREYCVEVLGKVVKSNIAKIGKEIIPGNIKIISKAEKPLPLEFLDHVDSERETRLNYRFLDLRNPKINRTFILKHKVIGYMHEFFRKNGFIEVHTPIIQSAGAEGGATLFNVKYYNKNAYLRQSPQLYKQMLMASGLDKVYEIGQAFRAEKFHTKRHVCEFLSLDAEMAWIESEEAVLNILEKMIVYVIKNLKKESLFKALNIKLKIPETPFKRITYDKAIKILKKEGIHVKWGEDLEDSQEKLLGNSLTKMGYDWYFITKYPSRIKPFYIMMDENYSKGFDFDYKGVEMASGGQREHRYNILVERMKEKGLNLRNFKFYLDAFRYGMPPHGGFGLGTERMIEKLLGMNDIKEIILFSRTPEQLVP